MIVANNMHKQGEVHSTTEKERFIDLLKNNKGILYKITYSYCRDADDRKDLEQEIVIQLWRSLKHYDSRYKLSTWIYRIALNVAISHYRKDVKRQRSNVPITETIFQIADDVFSEEIEKRNELLTAFIGQLDEFNKAIMILYLEDNSYREISQTLGITETNVGTKINRIKKMIKEYFSTIIN